jgi:tetratricopeptide (TPR) repeat protein
MRAGARAVAGIALLALAVRAAEAAADTPPSVWDSARDPAERGRWKLHARVQALMHPVVSDDTSSDEDDLSEELSLEQARAALEDADAAHSPDVRLAFDLGIVYERLAVSQGDDVLQEKVIDILVPALARAPDHPGAPEALSALAAAFAHVDRPREELATWRQYIPKLADADARLLPMMNMGEAEMRVGQIDSALSTFHAALDIAQSLPNSASLSDAYALILWDIAIALDRQGDPVDAFKTAAKARAFSWTINGPVSPAQSGVTAGLLSGVITQTGWDAIQDYKYVFFAPAWEREWYLALGEAAVASEATDARVAAEAWGKAEGHWSTYFTRATEAARDAGTGDSGADHEGVAARWTAMAKLRRDYAHRARVAAEKRARSLPGPRPASAP